MTFLKKKGQGFPLLSGLGATKSSSNTILKTVKATLRLRDFARTPVKPRLNKARDSEKPRVAPE
ncbi:hypothetical protein B0A62_24035 [Flavobacterium hydatis]|uniref:Uncharacterized protein n=1 Tax=Flavobacterium hydatis TaxID=991 RepID=A0ABX4C1C0_FLAHY|nr:hypothetical protein B0A62_24035 [Flavobacterium hydatis]